MSRFRRQLTLYAFHRGDWGVGTPKSDRLVDLVGINLNVEDVPFSAVNNGHPV